MEQNTAIPSYQYEQLLRPTADVKQVRVVTLRHGETKDELVISISLQNIHPEAERHEIHAQKDYEALSYTWGSDTQPRRAITVQNGLEFAHLEIYENLFTILQTLRLSDRDRTLWIDAICINQDNASDQARLEKSWQIPMMHEVYDAASRVIIWLGPEADDSTFALAFLQLLGENFVFDHTTLELIPQIRTLLDRPWFTRVWI
ncbi:uncharacterized protein MYCFIDRAFT_168584, partial [Pseudocercospora fijiensis CIRAD86]